MLWKSEEILQVETNAQHQLLQPQILMLPQPYVANMQFNDVNVCGSMKEVSIKYQGTSLYKTITWIKKSGKGRHEWVKFCENASFRPWKLKTPMNIHFTSKVIFLKKTSESKDVINLCYLR